MYHKIYLRKYGTHPTRMYFERVRRDPRLRSRLEIFYIRSNVLVFVYIRVCMYVCVTFM